jgi:RNA polymerase sigma-70 factor, ECF subfamily
MQTCSTNTAHQTPAFFANNAFLNVDQPLLEGWAAPLAAPPSHFDVEQLAKEHFVFLQERAFRLTRNHADAADLVQDTFEKALKFAPCRVASFRARGWLLVVMHNLFVDRYRSTRAAHLVHSQDLLLELPAPLETESDPDPQDLVTMDDVQAALTQVPGVLRRVFELRELEGKSYADIACTLQIPLVTVGTRLLRARRHIKATLAERVPLLKAA